MIYERGSSCPIYSAVLPDLPKVSEERGQRKILGLQVPGATGLVRGTRLASFSGPPSESLESTKPIRRPPMKRTILTLVTAAILAASALLFVPMFESESTPVVTGIGMADDGS